MTQYVWIAVALLLSACVPTGHVAQDNEPIKVGAILILSGIGADWGSATLDGAELAIKEINSQGGINGRELELVVEDNPSDDPKTAILAYHKLKSQNIDVIIGTTWSTSAWALMPLACEEQTLLISATIGTPQFTQECDYTFNTYPADTELSYSLGSKLASNGYRRIALIGIQESWYGANTLAVKSGFEDAGGEIAFFDLGDFRANEFKTLSARVVQAKPDAVFLMPYLAYTANAFQDLRDAGYKGQITTIYLDQEKIDEAQGAFEGAIVPTSVTPTAEYQNKFTGAYGTQATIGSDTGYDAVMLIAKAMRETGSTDTTVLMQYLKTVNQFSGASGELSFDEFGGAHKQEGYTIVRDGKIVPYNWGETHDE